MTPPKGKPALKNPRVHVVMSDGGEWDVQTMNPDVLKFERAAAKFKWPQPQQSPVTWLTFLAWAASQREGSLPLEVSWEEFSEDLCLEVSNPDGNTTAPPTQPDLVID